MKDSIKRITSDAFKDKQLQTVLDNTVDGIFVINSNGLILSFNKACERLFGFTADEIIGQNIHAIIPMQDAKIINLGHEATGRKKDQTEFSIWISMKEVIEENDRYFIGILRDISEQKQNEIALRRYTEALEHSNRELDEFVYIISHDLKEPIRGMHGYANFLLDDYGDKLDEDGKSKLQSLIKMSTRMDDLIDKLLYFSRLNRTELAYIDLDLNKEVSGIIDLSEPYIKERNAEIIIDTALPTIKCDQARAGEIFRNLITNAMKYNDSAKKNIHIGVMTDHPDHADKHVFYIKDNGIGIAEKYHEAIFKIFKRLHGRDAYGGGTGSGLAIVKKVIEQHQGKIWLESEVDKGTTFYFTLQN